MSQQKKQWGAIIVMIALFAMIAFVTNLCSPMANIIKAQGGVSEVLAQIGNYGNFVAYLIMGVPAGMLISKFGYKKTALIGLMVGIIGILVQWSSSLLDVACWHMSFSKRSPLLPLPLPYFGIRPNFKVGTQAHPSAEN